MGRRKVTYKSLKMIHRNQLIHILGTYLATFQQQTTFFFCHTNQLLFIKIYIHLANLALYPFYGIFLMMENI